MIQLKSEGVSKYSISKTLGVHRTTLEGYLRKLESTGKSYEILLGHSDQELVDIVYKVSNTYKPDDRLKKLEKQFKYFLKQLKYTGVTRRTLWEEYKETYPEGYGYTQFCEHCISFDKEGAEMLFSHLSLRAGRKSTIITTNLSFDRWSEIFGDPVLTAAMVDRLTHKAYIINMNGMSFRAKETKEWLNK